jgi:hypothetical protein
MMEKQQFQDEMVFWEKRKNTKKRLFFNIKINKAAAAAARFCIFSCNPFNSQIMLKK